MSEAGTRSGEAARRLAQCRLRVAGTTPPESGGGASDGVRKTETGRLGARFGDGRWVKSAMGCVGGGAVCCPCAGPDVDADDHVKGENSGIVIIE